MKKLQIWLVSLLCVANIFIASPALADRIAKKSPDYPVVVENLNTILAVQADPQQKEYTPEELKQVISDLQFQKYVLETSEDWGICRNETGKNIGIYVRNPKKATPSTLLYLGTGEETDDNWDCEGVYIPNDVNVASLEIPTGQPAAVRILDGTNLTISSNPDTGELILDAPPALIEVLDATDTTLSIPNIAQTEVDAQVANAPID
ncbi:hypothetical protein GM3708_3262 [Geminocystis sp. NIES-3708]|uniref:hypothetical protein n=1 Tax=Geminocystis sp. NIES-3708 TaxID=1615909 RepID=UPI0005FC8340|nr:hypothetical protein [Geminocystis sp. NIES-3708]BAQ62856.1 hypothetical protein GM3708_3262 [Geminocystis sp. NIES-3708]